MIRRFIAKILYVVLYLKLLRNINCLEKRIIPIYSHNTEARTLEQLIVWFQKHGFRFISTEEMLYQVKHHIIDSKQVWLSFDDGYENNYLELLPILELYKIPATFFVATKAIKDGYFWYQRAFQNRNTSLYNHVQDLWEMPNSRRIELVELLPAYVGNRSAISLEGLLVFAQSSLLTIANHTHDHVICDRCTDEELIEQINLCADFLQGICENYHHFFSYPNGNYDARVVRLIKGLGFEMACTTEMGFIEENTDLFNIPRNEFTDRASLEESVLSSFNLWTPIFNKIKRIFCMVNKK